MSKIFYIGINAKKRTELSGMLETNHTDILDKWIQQHRVQSVLNKKKINPVFFINHFGSRVLDYFIGVIGGEKSPGDCPVIMIMLKFFSRQGLKLDDIYQICSGMKNSVVYILLEKGLDYSDDKIAASVDLFDANFSGVIREYQQFDLLKYQGVRDEITSKCSSNGCLPEKVAIADEDCVNCSVLEEYFAADEDDDTEKVLFRTDDADDLLEYFSEVSEHLSLAVVHTDTNEIIAVANIFSHASSILLHYSPFLDALSASMSELSMALHDHTEDFMNELKSGESGILRLFDAVSADMERYIQRFSVESIAMRNSHHIHEPTTLSIRQIITMFAPNQIDAGEIEFF